MLFEALRLAFLILLGIFFFYVAPFLTLYKKENRNGNIREENYKLHKQIEAFKKEYPDSYIYLNNSLPNKYTVINYNKKIILYALIIILVTAVVVLSVGLFGFWESGKKLKEETNALSEKIEVLRSKDNEKETKIQNLTKELNTAKAQAWLLEITNRSQLEELSFYESAIAFVINNDRTYYHTIKCSTFEEANSYHAYNVRAAENRGYKAHSCFPAEQVSSSKSDMSDEVSASKTVYITPSGTKYHKKSCKYVKKSGIPKPLNDVKGEYSPCSVCNP